MELLNNKYFKWLVFATIAFLALFLAAATLSQLKKADTDSIVNNTITVSGKGEAVAVPDIAIFSFSVMKEAKNASDAQKEVDGVSNNILKLLKNNQIDESDIKTTAYNLYPKYDYQKVVCGTVYGAVCPEGKSVLIGYEVSQSFEVKVRDMEKVSNILSDITKTGVTNISGPNFMVDKEDDVIGKARNNAIDNAKEKARTIADGLGVRLGKIIGFSENENSYYSPTMKTSFDGAVSESSIRPQLPVGENKYSKTVQIIYEIK